MKLLKLHRNFLINKISVILLIGIILIGNLVNIFSIISLNNEYNWFDGKIIFIEYLNLNVLYYKLVVVNLICYIWGNFFIKSQNSYYSLITGYKTLKFKFIITKLFLLILFTFLIVTINIYLMSLIGITCPKLFYSHQIIIELYINMLFICLIFGLLSSLFAMILNHQYAYFLSVAIFVFGELIKDGTNGSKLYFVFFPSINNIDVSSFNFGIIHLLILFIIYFLVVLFGYLYKK